MTLTVMPDLQAFLSQLLRDQDEVVELVGQRVYNEVPGNPTWPLVRMTDIGGSGRSGPAHWQQQAVVQTDIWGGPTATVAVIAETIRACFMDATGAHTLADGSRIVVTKVDAGRARRGVEKAWPGKGSDDSSSKPHASFDTVFYFHP